MTDAGPPHTPTPAHNDAALEEAVRRYLPVVYAAARRQLPEAALADDVTQAVFMVLARRWSGLAANVVLSSWLLKVTHLTCLQARRDAGRRKAHERRASQMRPATTPTEVITHGQLAAELDAALAHLGETDRSVVTLRYLEQKSVADVAQHLGISPEATQKRIGRAMTRLREKLKVSEEQLGGTALGAFFLSQSNITVPAYLTAQVIHAVATAGMAGISTTAGVFSKAVLKTLFWSGLKVPLVIAAAAVWLVASAALLEQALTRHDGMPAATSGQVAPRDYSQAAPTNVQGAEYPRVDSQRRATFRIYAPDAKTVAVQIGDTYEMSRWEGGYWTVTTRPLAAGFHYYNLIVDGAAVPDPGSRTFLGSSKMLSGLEVPGEREDFFQQRDVPHGEIRAHYYHSELDDSTREAIVYTPPSYDAKPAARFPVLYLLPGMGEDEHAWMEQGHVAAILDNLIGQGRAREMIVVMEEAGTSGGPADPGGGGGMRSRGSGEFGGNFPQIFVSETIPMIDATYRTIPDREHRALAGVSLGGTQAFQMTQDNLNQFAYVGAFSAPFGYPDVPAGYNGLLARPDEFARRVKLLFFSAGTAEDLMAARIFNDQLENAGIPHVFFEVPGTSPGWQSWRPSLYEMVPLLFQN